MDHLHDRLERLEQRTHTVERQLRWWRGLACGLVVLAGLTWALPAVIAQEEEAKDKGQKGLAQRVAALEELLKHFSREGKEIFITGANLHLVNGLGRTNCGTEEEPIPDCPNGLGNLIVGYNESRPEAFGEDIRTGSHNVVVGQRHNFSHFGGLVVGDLNTISGDFAVVSGGDTNMASGNNATVSGGFQNTASGFRSVVSGGDTNTASFDSAAVSGGFFNRASEFAAAVSGGQNNTASGVFSAVSGGHTNTASSDSAAVSGGADNMASGLFSAVSGGRFNTASAFAAAVSGGQDRTAPGDFDWVAGSLVEDE